MTAGPVELMVRSAALHWIYLRGLQPGWRQESGMNSLRQFG